MKGIVYLESSDTKVTCFDTVPESMDNVHLWNAVLRIRMVDYDFLGPDIKISIRWYTNAAGYPAWQDIR